jgi:hypothetical protein
VRVDVENWLPGFCNYLIMSGLEVRGFEPLAFSLRTRRSTN